MFNLDPLITEIKKFNLTQTLILTELQAIHQLLKENATYSKSEEFK